MRLSGARLGATLDLFTILPKIIQEIQLVVLKTTMQRLLKNLLSFALFFIICILATLTFLLQDGIKWVECRGRINI